MSDKMEEGVRSEQQAIQQAQNEIMKGLKNEENAKQMVHKDLAVLKEEMKNLKMGSGSTVCSEASTGVGLGASGTFARPPALPPDTMKFSFQGRWNSKAGSLMKKMQFSGNAVYGVVNFGWGQIWERAGELADQDDC